MEKEPTLKGLIDSINKVDSLRIPRMSILNLQLYVEHYVNEIVATLVDESAKSEIRKSLSFPQKLRILRNKNIIDNVQLKILETLNKIRDMMVHELVINPDEIMKKMKYSKFYFTYGFSFVGKDGKKNTKIIDLKKMFKKIPNKFSQLNISTILIIGILYNNLKIIKKQKPNQIINLEIVKKEEKDYIQFGVLEI
jgi:hypothetical protein